MKPFRATPPKRYIEPRMPPSLALRRKVAACEDDEDALDAIYQTVDRWMRHGEWAAVSATLATWPTDGAPVRALAMLSITLPARGMDRCAVGAMRERYAKLLRTSLERNRPDEVEALLAGLE